jgi:hypothetical protein
MQNRFAVCLFPPRGCASLKQQIGSKMHQQSRLAKRFSQFSQFSAFSSSSTALHWTMQRSSAAPLHPHTSAAARAALTMPPHDHGVRRLEMEPEHFAYYVPLFTFEFTSNEPNFSCSSMPASIILLQLATTRLEHFSLILFILAVLDRLYFLVV